MQDTIPWLRFAADGSTSDPQRETEAVGDDNPVQSTGYGLENIKRLVPMLVPATTQPTEDNSDLNELYGRLIGQWATELGHVANLVGGVETQDKYGSQPGPVYTPVAGSRQRAAVRFLNQNAFQTPTYLLLPAVTTRIEDNAGLAQVNSAQARVLASLFQTPASQADRDRGDASAAGRCLSATGDAGGCATRRLERTHRPQRARSMRSAVRCSIAT